MATLPVAVTALQYRGGGTYAVTVNFHDGTVRSYLIPDTMATVEAVRISALVMAMLADPALLGKAMTRPPVLGSRAGR